MIKLAPISTISSKFRDFVKGGAFDEAVQLELDESTNM